MKYQTSAKYVRAVGAILFTICCSLYTSPVKAQVGEYRNDFAIGVNAGVSMSNVGFVPKVPQSQLVGKTAGITLRYTGEKYFNSICAIVAELNYAEMGWKERLEDLHDNPVMKVALDPETGKKLWDETTNKYLTTDEPERYARRITYLQVPVFARLGWGRERRGFQFYFQTGPQLGFYHSEKTESNFLLENRNAFDRTSTVIAQDTMSVENKLDYGIAAGLGLEFSHPKVGHFLLEGRYYFGLGNIYGNSKRDFFAKSNFQTITIKLSYLFDVIRVKNSKIK